MQLYCPTCSAKKADARTETAQAQKYGRPPKSRAHDRLKSICDQNGKKINELAVHGHGWAGPVCLAWYTQIAVPFSYAGSKNHIYQMTGRHVTLRSESRAYRQAISLQLKAALRGTQLVQNKVWLSIFVQKPDHRGDAVNVVDLVCDAVKDAIGIDDRWFCIKRLDWEISKTEPSLYIGVGQEVGAPVQACSSCGRLLPFGEFGKKSSNVSGVDRNCSACRSATNAKRWAGLKSLKPAAVAKERKSLRRELSRRAKIIGAGPA
jgi:uncharacterized Zn finger protein (UPF0148 family)